MLPAGPLKLGEGCLSSHYPGLSYRLKPGQGGKTPLVMSFHEGGMLLMSSSQAFSPVLNLSFELEAISQRPFYLWKVWRNMSPLRPL